MPSLDISGLTSDQRPTGAWAAALLLALAREEAVGRRPQRLTEPRLATWTRFRGRLTSVDLVALLFEDAAVINGGAVRQRRAWRSNPARTPSRCGRRRVVDGAAVH